MGKTPEPEYAYVGGELELFQNARNWRSYWTSRIGPIINGRVLEVGAGIGNATLELSKESDSWLALEPDPKMAEIIRKRVGEAGHLNVEVRSGFLSDLPASELFDAIIYIDVLEHIENDSLELQNAAELLSPGGVIVVLSPAYRFLYSEFDKSVGHFRRYSKSKLVALAPRGTEVLAAYYLDSLGAAVSFANRVILRSGMPKPSQIALWDNKIVPVSRYLDWLSRNSFGRSVVAVFEKKTGVPSE